MTNSDEMYGTPGISDEDVLSTEASRAQDAAARGEVLGVLTGQVPVRSMPVAGGKGMKVRGGWVDEIADFPNKDDESDEH